MYKYGTKSLEKLSNVHPVLQEVMKEVIKRTPIDFSIICGQRSMKEQQRLYANGKSKINGTTKKSKHNFEPALAIDFMPIVNGKGTFKNMNAFAIIVGVIMSTAKQMGVETRSGITFGSKIWKGWDAGHIELVGNPPLKFKKEGCTMKHEGKETLLSLFLKLFKKG